MARVFLRRAEGLPCALVVVPSLRDSFLFLDFPRTYVLGHHIPPLRGLSRIAYDSARLPTQSNYMLLVLALCF